MKSVLQSKKECMRCGTTYGLHVHHVFGGPCRGKADALGLTVYLCGDHHNMSPEGVHFNRDYDLQLKQQAQRYYMTHYGDIKDFINDFIRSYL